MSKLDNLDSRIHRLEDHLIFQPHPSPHYSPPPAHDPKGKAPMVSPLPSPTASPTPTPHILSPHPFATAPKSPSHDPVPITSDASSFASSESPTQEFELTARTTVSPHSSIVDSEATSSPTLVSDPAKFIVTPPPSPPPPPPPPSTSLSITSYTRSKLPSVKNPSYPPSPRSPPPPSHVQPTPPPRPAPTPYTCRKLTVTWPSTSPPPPPPPPS